MAQISGTEILNDAKEWLVTPNAVRDILVICLAMIIGYWLSRFLAQAIIRIAQIISTRSDIESNETRVMRLRQTETYLSITVAIVRAAVVIAVGYIAWIIVNPFSASSAMNKALAGIRKL